MNPQSADTQHQSACQAGVFLWRFSEACTMRHANPGGVF
jgi:hypothetical protein